MKKILNVSNNNAKRGKPIVLGASDVGLTKHTPEFCNSYAVRFCLFWTFRGQELLSHEGARGFWYAKKQICQTMPSRTSDRF